MLLDEVNITMTALQHFDIYHLSCFNDDAESYENFQNANSYNC